MNHVCVPMNRWLKNSPWRGSHGENQRLGDEYPLRDEAVPGIREIAKLSPEQWPLSWLTDFYLQIKITPPTIGQKPPHSFEPQFALFRYARWYFYQKCFFPETVGYVDQFPRPKECFPFAHRNDTVKVGIIIHAGRADNLETGRGSFAGEPPEPLFQVDFGQPVRDFEKNDSEDKPAYMRPPGNTTYLSGTRCCA